MSAIGKEGRTNLLAVHGPRQQATPMALCSRGRAQRRGHAAMRDAGTLMYRDQNRREIGTSNQCQGDEISRLRACAHQPSPISVVYEMHVLAKAQVGRSTSAVLCPVPKAGTGPHIADEGLILRVDCGKQCRCWAFLIGPSHAPLLRHSDHRGDRSG